MLKRTVAAPHSARNNEGDSAPFIPRRKMRVARKYLIVTGENLAAPERDVDP